jgi:aspartate-semialdehyde dehydrogenase
VSDGHSAGLFIKFANKKPSLEEIKQIWNNFKPEYSIAGLCLAPENPIVYIEEHGRPRPDVDLMTGKGMTVSMGELEKSTLPFFDVQCVGFSNNMIRGAAGGALYGLEVAIAQGYVK